MKLVERDALLAQLESLLQGVAGGRGQIVLLGGEAGIGKTSLLGELRARAGEARVWWGACEALQTPHPLAPLYDIARGGDVGFRPLMAAESDRIALFEAVLSELQSIRRPCLLVVEDAHWADEASLDLLRFLGRRIEQAPCLMVISYRDDEVDASHALRRLMGALPAAWTTRMDIPRLSAAAVDTMARSAFRAPENIHAITQGNPFFVTELLRQGQGSVPRGVQDLVLARFARISPPAQDIVRLAAVVPARIERWLVEVLLSPSLEALEECLNSGLLLATADSLAFRHELARVAVESSLSRTLAQALHARVLSALESDARAQASLARLAHHAAHADDAAAVLRLATQAAREAQRRGAHKQAAAHVRSVLDHARALPDSERAALLDWLSYEFYLTDRIADALAARHASQELWHALGEGLREGDAWRWLSRLSWYNGQSGPAEAFAARAIEVLEALPPGRELAMAYSNRSQLRMLANQPEAALEWGRKALALTHEPERDQDDVEIHVLNNIGTAKLDLGDTSGWADLERSLELALSGGYEEHAARAFTNLSYCAMALRDYAAVDRYLDRGIAFCDERDLDSWSRYMSAYRAEVRLSRGEWDRAEAEASAVVEAERSAPISRISALAVIGRIRARRGDGDPMPALDEALRLALPTQSPMRIGLVAAARAEAAFLRGDLASAIAEASRCPLSARPSNNTLWAEAEQVYWLHRGGASPTRMENCPAAIALEISGQWRDAAAAWQALGCPYERARALAAGDVEAQREALAALEELGARPEADRLRRQLQAAGVRGLPRGQRASTKANPHELTDREVEVLALLTEGLSNAQIAERLHRSVRTVDHHLAAAFSKLGVSTRVQAAAAARAAGIGSEK